MSFDVLAPAKVNLFLNVVGRRADGYHELESLFAFCALHDRLTAAEDDELRFRLSGGPFSALVESDDSNLAMRAALLLRSETGARQGAAITLDKRIPVAAGLGGGSADAAAALRLLNMVWGLGLPIGRLEELAVGLGADVPACLRGAPVYARGIGERLEPAPALPECGVLLVNPLAPTPTPAVFQAFRKRNPEVAARDRDAPPASFGSLADLVRFIAARGNDLLPAALEVTPVIGDVLDELRSRPQAAHAGLSGSGATCFALFGTVTEADDAARLVRAKRPSWWAWSGGWAEPSGD